MLCYVYTKLVCSISEWMATLSHAVTDYRIEVLAFRIDAL